MATKHDKFFGSVLIFCFALLILLTCVSVCRADWTPTDFNTWKKGNEYMTDIGRLPENYQKADGSWEEIDTVWQSVGDTLFKCEKAVVTTAAWPNGNSEIVVDLGNHRVAIRRTLDRLILYDTLTEDRYDLITDIPLSNFTRKGRELNWQFPGGNYRLRKDFGRTAAQVVFKKPLLDSICKIYDKLPLDSITTMVDSMYWDEEGDTLVIVQVPVITTLSERVALGTVFRYEISGVSDSLLAKLLSRPGVNRKKLLQFGRRHLSITSNKLHFQGEENVQDIPVLQEWRKHPSKLGTFYLCEYLMMWQLDSLHTVWPNKAVWHGATEQVQDMSVEDTYITQPVANRMYNYGANILLRIAASGAGNDTIALVRCVGVAAALGSDATVNSCSLHLPISSVDINGTIHMFRLFKYFIEGTETNDRPDPDSGATWNMFQGFSFRLGLAGYQWAEDDAGDGPDCDHDDGVDNVIDNGTCVAARADRTFLSMSNIIVNATGWWKLEVTTSLAQNWYNGDAVENGVLLQPSVVSVKMNSSEATGDINGEPDKPFFRFRYEIAEAAGQVIIID